MIMNSTTKEPVGELYARSLTRCSTRRLQQGERFQQVTTLSVTVDDNITQEQWRETPDLIHSTGVDKDYMVEIGEDGMSSMRFGNGVNGMKLPDAATVVCSYMKDFSGTAGNVGADTLRNYDRQHEQD